MSDCLQDRRRSVFAEHLGPSQGLGVHDGSLDVQSKRQPLGEWYPFSSRLDSKIGSRERAIARERRAIFPHDFRVSFRVSSEAYCIILDVTRWKTGETERTRAVLLLPHSTGVPRFRKPTLYPLSYGGLCALTSTLADPLCPVSRSN